MGSCDRVVLARSFLRKSADLGKYCLYSLRFTGTGPRSLTIGS